MEIREIGVIGIISTIGIIGAVFVYASSDHLLISQVQITGGSGKTTNDFIEIYNPTNSDIDLKGMRLVKRTKTGTADTLIKSWTDSAIVKPYSYYLWANSDFTNIVQTPDIKTSASIANDNGIAIRNGPNDTGSIVDSVGWGEAVNAFVEGVVLNQNPQANQSIIRKPADQIGNGTDTDNNSADFILNTQVLPRNSQTSPTQVVINPVPAPQPPPAPAPAPPPAPVPAPLPPPPSVTYSKAVIISEFMPNPQGKDPGKEWVELLNTSNSEVDLSGWKLDDEGKEGVLGSSAFIFPDGIKVPPNQYHIQVLTGINFDLDNTKGDALRLFWPNNTLVDQVVYTADVEEEVSFAKKGDNFELSQTPTPGKANEFGTIPKVSDEKAQTETKESPKVVVENESTQELRELKEVEIVKEEMSVVPTEVVEGKVAAVSIETPVAKVAKNNKKDYSWEIFSLVGFVLLVSFWYIYFRIFKKK